MVEKSDPAFLVRLVALTSVLVMCVLSMVDLGGFEPPCRVLAHRSMLTGLGASDVHHILLLGSSNS